MPKPTAPSPPENRENSASPRIKNPKRCHGSVHTIQAMILTSSPDLAPSPIHATRKQRVAVPLGGMQQVHSHLQKHVPTELIYAIFMHIHPNQVLKFRRLCRSIDACLSESHFAKLNLAWHTAPTSSPSSPSRNKFIARYADRFATAFPTEWDRCWFQWPDYYQHAYVELPGSLLPQTSRIPWGTSSLSGTIPRSLGCLKLTYLNLSCNSLHGRIPPELGQLKGLLELNLSENELHGIPRELGQLTLLRTLNLSSNPLGGCIPPELGKLVHLQSLQLVMTNLSGNLPTQLCNLRRLRELHIACNRALRGTIPEFGALKSLQVLNLSANALEGEVPRSLSQLPHLVELNIASNLLVGQLPGEVLTMPSLRELKTHGNMLSCRVMPAQARGKESIRTESACIL